MLFGDDSPSGRLTRLVAEVGRPVPARLQRAGQPYDPRYAFGHGRSYTRFTVRALDGPRGIRQGESARFDVTLANTGGRSAEHTLLAFARPASGGRGELAGFQRTWVRRGDRDRFRVAVDTTQLEPGSYRIEVGELSRQLEVR